MEEKKINKYTTHGNRIRALKKESLREYLSNQKLHQSVIKIANKLDTEYIELEAAQIQSLKASADIKLKLINKYLPDLKAIEHSQDPENPITEMSSDELTEAIQKLTDKLNES